MREMRRPPRLRHSIKRDSVFDHRYRGHKAIAALRNCFYIGPTASFRTQRLSQHRDIRGQAGFIYERIRPQPLHQLVLETMRPSASTRTSRVSSTFGVTATRRPW
jgi:hypothetical protein